MWDSQETKFIKITADKIHQIISIKWLFKQVKDNNESSARIQHNFGLLANAKIK